MEYNAGKLGRADNNMDVNLNSDRLGEINKNIDIEHNVNRVNNTLDIDETNNIKTELSKGI